MLPLLFGAAAIIGGIAIVALWDEIVSWLSDLFYEIKRILVNVMHAAAVYIERAEQAWAKLMHRLYYKEGTQWMEQTTTRKIPESELPPEIRRRMLNRGESEVTEELEAMGLEV